MNWDAVGAIGEAIGAVAVVATLIYLAGQLRQNTKALRSSRIESYASLSFSINDFRAAHAEVLAKHFAGGDLSPTDRIVANAHAQKIFTLMETSYLHHQEGTLTSEVFEARIMALSVIMANPAIRSIWDQSKTFGFTNDFVALVEGYIPDDA